MANKRTSELTSITATEVAVGDLFNLSDISAIESKKLTVLALTDYLQGEITSSATASYGLKAASASYLTYDGSSNGTASNSMTSSFSITASYVALMPSASYSITSSYAITSSNSRTASYALSSMIQYSDTSAFSNNADQSETASYISYTGIANGTSSYSLLSATSLTSTTSSYINYTGIANGTASYALTASNSRSASLLIWNGASTNNGTSSWSYRTVLAEQASTASYLNYDGTNFNGSASYSLTSTSASNAVTASSAITASYAIRTNLDENSYNVFGPYVITPAGTPVATASIQFSTTSSVDITGVNVILQFEGDIQSSFTGSFSSEWDMVATNISGAPAPVQMLGNYLSPGTSNFSMVLNPDISCSLRRDFVVRGQTNLDAGISYTGKLLCGSGTIYKTDTRGIICWIYTKFDNINLV
jgi:hypothetical protein